MTATSSPSPILFDENVARCYDERFGKVGAINDNLHLLIRLILAGLPADARILCAGVGTGTEIVRLAEVFPGWTFTGVDPSAAMLAVCRERLAAAGLAARCTLVQGYVADLPRAPRYDAVLCLLVTHFIRDPAQRQALFGDMAARLESGGYLINADISEDLASPGAGPMIAQWQAMHAHAGAPPEKLDDIPRQLREDLAVAPPAVMEDYLRAAGFPVPVPFFQSLMIRAWFSRKP